MTHVSDRSRGEDDRSADDASVDGGSADGGSAGDGQVIGDRPGRRIEVDPVEPSSTALMPAADVLRGGGLVAFPTETVYGLGANAFDAAAVAQIFSAKHRPANNPLIVHIADGDAAQTVVSEWPDLAGRLAEAFWPGPLTMILPKNNTVSDTVTAGLDTVGVRVPAHPVARKLIEMAGVAVAAPSANRYTEVSPTRADHVFDSLGDAVDCVVDAGRTAVGVESTVLSLVGDTPRILRPGMITAAMIRAAMDAANKSGAEAIDEDGLEVVYGAGLQQEGADRPKSPGLARKHYAPDARVAVVDDAAKMAALVGGDRGVGFVLVDPVEPVPCGPVRVLGGQPDDYAKRLYAALRHMDQQGCPQIIVQRPPAGEPWRAIHDRLGRAST